MQGKIDHQFQKIRISKTRQRNATNRKCLFCDDTVHKLKDFTKVKDLVKRRQKVSWEKFVFQMSKIWSLHSLWSKSRLLQMQS